MRPKKEVRLYQTKMVLTPEQNAWIKEQAAKRGASFAQVVRDALNLAIETLKAKAGK